MLTKGKWSQVSLTSSNIGGYPNLKDFQFTEQIDSTPAASYMIII